MGVGIDRTTGGTFGARSWLANIHWKGGIAQYHDIQVNCSGHKPGLSAFRAHKTSRLLANARKLKRKPNSNCTASNEC